MATQQPPRKLRVSGAGVWEPPSLSLLPHSDSRFPIPDATVPAGLRFPLGTLRHNNRFLTFHSSSSSYPTMICVSIGRGLHRHMIAEYLGTSSIKGRLIWWSCGWTTSTGTNLKRLVADRPCPGVITCRRTADGGKFTGSEEQRRLLLRTAIAEGVEWTFECASSASCTKRIVKSMISEDARQSR